MTSWPKDRPLEKGMKARPVLWVKTGWVPRIGMPRVSAYDFDLIFGTDPGQKGNRLRTFGHVDGPKGAPLIPHYLATRGTTPMHHDPGYPRYSVQLAIYNTGLALQGVDGHPIPLPPGTLYCLDTHSPHQVIRHGPDPTTFSLKPLPRQKLQAAIDYHDQPKPTDDFTALRDYITRHHPTKD